jgi:hypothetical protein
MFRGTKMSYNDLISYHEGLSRTKKDLPALTEGNTEPLAIINVFNHNQSPEQTGRFILRSMGTILRNFDHD